MKARYLGLVIGLLAFILLFLNLPAILQAEENVFHCDVGFEATIRQGPSAETTLLGDLEFDLDDTGSLIGQFLVEDGTQILIAGQVVGHSISMIFDLGDERYIYGVGVSLRDVRSDDCGGPMGGPFVGPGEGDSGDWRGKGKPGRGVIQITDDSDQTIEEPETPISESNQ